MSWNLIIPLEKMLLLILSWFYSTKWLRIIALKWVILSKLKPSKERFEVFQFTEHAIGFLFLTLIITTSQGCTGFESTLLSSSEELKQGALTVQPWRHFLSWNNRKYVDPRFSDVINVKNSYRKYLISRKQVFTFKKWNRHYLTVIYNKITNYNV